MKLSVIIPVYAVEATLERCVRSVAILPYADMEIILVDDGSPDGCPALCDSLAERLPVVRVIHKTNGGLSSARNAGLDLASGDYVTFVDSDDCLAPATLARVMAAASPDADIIEYSATVLAGHPSAERQLALPDMLFGTFAGYHRSTLAFAHSYACNKVFRRRLFDGVRFREGRLFEDAWLMRDMYSAYGESLKIQTTSAGNYIYNYNSQGLTARADGLKLADLVAADLSHPLLRTDTLYYMYMANNLVDVYCSGAAEPAIGEIPRLPRGCFPFGRLMSARRSGLTALPIGATAAKWLIAKLFSLHTLCRLYRIFLTIRHR